ncbi:zinc ion binding protein, partial [Magnaporthiopsis poae ATCC 64411]|uniref:Zinc ion binding protein n=1 Tax=Magnaporthiopsis poae (strain ATCC 64411 / 73-15) TaxID=644358 RepID=A0A0C4E201_MAGP6
APKGGGGGGGAESNSRGPVVAAGAASQGRPPPKALLLDSSQDGGGGGGSASSKKRAFELDEEEVARIAAEDRAKARRTIDGEKANKPTLPSFWAPTVTPTSNQHNVLHEIKKHVKKEPVCPSSKEDNPHPLSLHSLTAIHFTEDGDPAEEQEGTDAKDSGSSSARTPRQRICPACRKALSNSSKAVLAKPCGHVVCKSCVAQFMTPSGRIDAHAPGADPDGVRCFVCDADVTERKPSSEKHKKERTTAPGLVELRSEGTGFSASGVNQVKKLGVSFQC